MPTIPLSRSKHIQPFAALLKKAGEPVGRALLKARLPGGCLEHSDTVISADAVFRFREHCGLVLGSDDIALDATRDLQFETLGEFGRALLGAPTLSRLLTTFRDFLNTQTSITEIELKRLESGDVAFSYRFNHLPEVGVWHSDLYTFQWATKIIRLAIPTWAPNKVWSVSSNSPNRQELFRQLGVHQVEFQKNCTGFLIPSSVLALPLTRNLADGGPVDESLLQTTRLPETETQAIHNVVQAYTGDRWLSIVETGDVLGMSVRTIQRRLAEEGTTYSKVFEQIRAETAGKLLETTEMTLQDIAKQLGYGSQSNFTRAFCRWAGVSPSVFRLQRRVQ